MTKQEQIEEMVSIMAASNNPFVDVPVEIMPNVAEALYNAGYRKLPKDSVVLSREEYERLKRVENEKDRLYEIKLDLENQLIEKGWTDYEGADEIEKRVSKETAKEFAEKLKNKLFEFFQDNEELDGKISVGILYVDVIGVEAKDGTIISLGLVDKLLKEYENEKRNN